MFQVSRGFGVPERNKSKRETLDLDSRKVASLLDMVRRGSLLCLVPEVPKTGTKMTSECARRKRHNSMWRLIVRFACRIICCLCPANRPSPSVASLAAGALAPCGESHAVRSLGARQLRRQGFHEASSRASIAGAYQGNPTTATWCTSTTAHLSQQTEDGTA